MKRNKIAKKIGKGNIKRRPYFSWVSLLLMVLASLLFFEAQAQTPEVSFQISPSNSATFHGIFQGFGAEWDPFYWNTNNLNRGTNQAGWNLITSRIRDLHPGIVRIMMQLYWAQTSPDLTNWTWNTPQMESVFKYLDFCQANDIDVILTDWGWSASGNLYAGPTDMRFARGIAAYLKEFIERRGYTCIKYLVVGNEPDNEIERSYGMDAYVTMYFNVDQALKDAGIRSRLKLTGPDMGGQWDFMKEAINRLKTILDTYDFHRYASMAETANSNLPGTWESLWSHLDLWRGEILARDPQAAGKELLVSEMGNDGGTTNSHPLIDTFEYALHMADYGTTLLTTRIQAGVAWCMHDIYYFDGGQFMQWGMWRYLDEGWKLRPWAQSFGLLIKHAPRGSIQAAVNSTPPQTPDLSQYRCAALMRPDGGWSIFLVNRTPKAVSVNVNLPSLPQGDFDRYQFDRNSITTFPDTIALPASGTFAKSTQLRITLPAESFTVLVETVGSLLTGDVNQDTQVNVLDIQACVNHILGIQDYGTRADVNNDGSVNVLDVQEIVNIILGT